MGFSINDLNDAQREAVTCTEGPLLVLAGAGSGKTRVLTYRIAHLVEDMGVSPYEVLAITFTNKAAAEMKSRLAALLDCGIRGMWVCTFHAMCVRMLRIDAEKLGYTRDFAIYDDDDSKRLVKEIMAELEIDPKAYPINGIRAKISAAKNDLVSAEDFAANAKSNPFLKKASQVYNALQARLLRANAMDFDDLLVNAYRLLDKNPDVLGAYQRRFRYILVDEYQDTNHAQYLLVNMLAAGYENVMVVGDDDQSIYSWRGADITNILEFERDYAQAKTVKLEQNYRSTGTILKAANAVVAHNEARKAKTLFTKAADGDKIQAYLASDERDEGRWIAAEIERLRKKSGYGYDDFALFYRTNAQSRTLEDMLLRAGIPYRIAGGTRFFDRAEVRDVMAYLKAVVNPADDISAKRVINTPRRGIGKGTVEKIEQDAREQRVSFLEAARDAVARGVLPPRAQTAIAEFLALLDEAREYQGALRDVVEMIVDKTGLIAALEAERTDQSRGRIENIREFYSVAQEFDESHAGEEEDAELAELPPSKLAAFMEWVALRSDLDALGDEDGSIVLMTVHSAKGLEFPVVFVAGLEESIFPHAASANNARGIEEERRLAYVAITRAKERLYLTYTQSRMIFGSTQSNPRSRFIDEIPGELIEFAGIGSAGLWGTGYEKRGDRRGTFGSGSGGEVYGGRVFGAGQGASTRPEPKFDTARAEESFAVGDAVDHKVFGRGIVTEVKGDALTIAFVSGKTKNLLKGYAPIVKIAKH